MKSKLLLLSLTAINIVAMAGEKMSDPEIKQKLLGYWESPRHGYLIKSRNSYIEIHEAPTSSPEARRRRPTPNN